MSITILSREGLERSLAVRDLSDPSNGPHAIQLVVNCILEALTCAWQCPVVLERASPIVSIRDNYERSRYPEAATLRDARYSRYVSADTVLRASTSAMIPPMLDRLAT